MIAIIPLLFYISTDIHRKTFTFTLQVLIFNCQLQCPDLTQHMWLSSWLIAQSKRVRKPKYKPISPKCLAQSV